jgi:hypothetical protein
MKCLNFTKRALLVALMCSSCCLLSAKDVYLSNPSLGGDDVNDGSTSELAVATLSRAYAVIGGAAGPHTIYVSGEVDGHSNPADAQGVYPFLGTPYTLTVQGVTGTSPKVVGDNNARMFRLRSDMVLKLKDLTLSGSADNTITFIGGCILMDGGSLEVDNCLFENFVSTNYGAVIMTNSVSAAIPLIALRNCVFRNNSATGTNGYGSVMRIADYGTGLEANARANAKVYVENCAFVDNHAMYGTFFFRTNYVAAPYPVITFVNSTFTGNSNENGNAGSLSVYSGNQTINVINCTFKDNTTNGAIRVTAAATVNVYNTISEGCSAYDMSCDNNPVLTVYNSLILKSRNVPDYTKPVAYTSADQLLEGFNATTNSFTPKENSLAIGYGDKQYLQGLGLDGMSNINYDQLNQPRPFLDDKCDAGAVEYQTADGLQLVESRNNLAYSGVAGQIIVQSDASAASVYTITGQKLAEQSLNGGSVIIGRRFDAGVYLVKTGSKITKVIVK